MNKDKNKLSVTQPTCVLCGHNNVDREGYCKTEKKRANVFYNTTRYCGCKCEFSVTQEGAPTEAPERIYDAKHGEKEILEAIWKATENENFALTELARDEISVATIAELRARVSAPTVVGGDTELKPCEWCADPKVTRRFLSDDAGCTIEATGGAEGTYTLSHAWDDAWWPCLASGKEIKITITRTDHSTAPKVETGEARVLERKLACMNPNCVDGKVSVGCAIDKPLLTTNCPECNPPRRDWQSNKQHIPVASMVSTAPKVETEETGGTAVQASGVYTGENWFRVAPFGGTHRTIIKTYDPRVFPSNEEIHVATVDPASEVPVEIAEANADLIVKAVNSYDHSTERIKVLTEALKEVLNSGIELDDARMNYVVMQVDRSTLADARAALVDQGE